MQLFPRKKKTEKTQPTEKKAAKGTKDTPAVSQGSAAGVLIRPHITEKAAILADDHGYVFVVSPDANKTMIKHAIKEVYGKEPVKVNIAKKPNKSVLRRKGRGVRRGYTKAYVYLKKGEAIDIV